METFDNTIEKMLERRVVTVDGGNQSVGVNINDDGQFNFLCSMFWPFIGTIQYVYRCICFIILIVLDSYWLMCVSFYALSPSFMMEEKTFMDKVQSLGFTLYYEGDLGYYEGISKETLNNAMTLYLSLGVIEKQIIDTKSESSSYSISVLCT